MKRNNLIILIVMVLVMTLVMSFSILAKGVTIIDGEKVTKVVTFKNNVKELVEHKKIVLKDDDRLIPELDTLLKDNMEVVIKRAVPLNIAVGREEGSYLSSADTVEQVLEELRVEIGEKDIVTPDISAQVTSGMNIKIIRVTEEIKTCEKGIPFEKIVQTSSQIDKGIEKIIKKGYNGKVREKLKITYHDGEEVEREVINEEIITEPQNAIIEEGIRDILVTSRGDIRFKKAVYMTATAYDATYESTGKRPGDKGYGITRSGTHVRPGVVAVDPGVIPLGTKLFVKSLDASPDYGFASAEDTGGAIKGNKIDLYFESPEDVRKYGKRKVIVYILE